MDCARAMQLLSEAHDLGDEYVQGIAKARAHCSGCPDCARFVVGLRALDDAPTQRAPESVVARVIETTRAEGSPAAAQLAPVPAAGAAAPSRPQGWWVPRLTAIAAAAAVLVGVALVTRAGIVSIRGGGTEKAADTAAVRGDMSTVPTLQPEGAPSAGQDEALIQEAPATVPSYIVFDGFVYVLAGPAEVDRSKLETVGAVQSALAQQGAAKSRDVYDLAGLSAVVYLQDDAGAWLGFRLVTRRFGDGSFALQSPPIYRFGEWPSLPSGYPTPTSASGSPTFQSDGTDTLGVTVYPAVGSEPLRGFAVAPGTSAQDPAGGNPNWTWWAPVAESGP